MMEALNGQDEQVTSIFSSESPVKENTLFFQGTADIAGESLVGQRRFTVHQGIQNDQDHHQN